MRALIALEDIRKAAGFKQDLKRWPQVVSVFAVGERSVPWRGRGCRTPQVMAGWHGTSPSQTFQNLLIRSGTKEPGDDSVPKLRATRRDRSRVGLVLGRSQKLHRLRRNCPVPPHPTPPHPTAHSPPGLVVRRHWRSLLKRFYLERNTCVTWRGDELTYQQPSLPGRRPTPGESQSQRSRWPLWAWNSQISEENSIHLCILLVNPGGWRPGFPTLGPAWRFLSHRGCPFGLVNQESSCLSPGRAQNDTWKAKVGFCVKASPPPFPFYQADECFHPPLWLTSRWIALVGFECHIIGIVANREMLLFVFLSFPVLTIFCVYTLSFPLYKVAVNNSWKCLSLFFQGYMSLECCVGTAVSLGNHSPGGAQLGMWQAGRVWLWAHGRGFKSRHILEDFLSPNSGCTITWSWNLGGPYLTSLSLGSSSVKCILICTSQGGEKFLSVNVNKGLQRALARSKHCTCLPTSSSLLLLYYWILILLSLRTQQNIFD